MLICCPAYLPLCKASGYLADALTEELGAQKKLPKGGKYRRRTFALQRLLRFKGIIKFEYPQSNRTSYTSWRRSACGVDYPIEPADQPVRWKGVFARRSRPVNW